MVVPAKLHCGDCQSCPARRQGFCSGCPGCGRLVRDCQPGRQCDKCRYVCPDWHGDGIWAHIHTNLGGLGFPDGAAIRSPELPAHIPMVSAPLHEPVPDGLLEWVAIHAGKAGKRTWEKGGVREHFGFPADTNIILDLYVRDSTLRGFWLKRQEWPGILAAERAAAFAPNFSVYEDAPRIEHLICMKMSAVTAAEMAAAGILVVPDVSWYEIGDLERWAAFITASGAKAAGFSFQVVGLPIKGDDVWKEYLAGFRYFCGLLSPGVRVAVIGANSIEKLREIAGAAGERHISLVDTTSFVSARKGGCFVSTGEGKKRAKESARSMSLDQVFFENVRRRKMLVQNLQNL